MVGGVDPADLPEHAELLDALTRTFVVSLELRESAVTELADVVLPVAPHQEKVGHVRQLGGPGPGLRGGARRPTR